LQHIPISLVFTYGIDGQDFNILPENPQQELFIPTHEYIEGGDFRVPLTRKNVTLLIKNQKDFKIEFNAYYC
jgi:hypothetical protein